MPPIQPVIRLAGAGVLLLVLPVLLPAQVPTPPAAPTMSRATPSDRTALAIIFSEQHTDESALDVHWRAMSMPPEERFVFLSHWVLPNEDHAAFRVHAGFTPTDLFPGTAQGHGGEIVSPALDLIAAAAALNCLGDLRQQVDSTSARPTQSQIARLALLALIDMAREELDSACEHLEDLFALVPADVSEVAEARDALLLCVHEAARHVQTSRIVVDPAYRIVMSYLEVYEREPWHRQFSAASARARVAAGSDEAATPPQQSIGRSAQWLAVSRPLARYRGTGCPPAHWRFEPGQVENVSSHDDDYLYFTSPLRGDFAVECDVTGFGWRDSHLLVCGKWVAPVYDHESYDLGDIRGLHARTKFAPRLTKTIETIHYRTAVRQGAATTWFNGRQIHTEPLPPEHDPWLAIRSAPRHDGAVRNLRITGTPQIPETLRLSDSPDLAGWVPYFGDLISSAMRDWSWRIGPEGRGEIYGRRRPELPRGCHQESLLVYHRPMFEDGSIAYEFWYEPNRSVAHPALGRLCLLLNPEGVKVHWLTDGKYERTGLAPDNVEESGNKTESRPLRLRAGAWNRVRLTVTGDALALTLNDEPVYKRKLERDTPRTFGLFHYADQTELRVREVTWKGDWPTALPPLEQQDLYLDETGFIDERLPELAATFSHDFAAGGLPFDRFSVVQGDLTHHVSIDPDGVRVRRPAVEAYRNITLAPSLTVGGDFDITATFDGLLTDPQDPGTSSAIMLMAIADTEVSDDATLVRQRSLARGLDRQFVQCVRGREVNGRQGRHYFNNRPVEATSGALRLARRGDQIYYLFAETDSSQFRLIGQQSFPTNDLKKDGVHLVAQIQGENGSTSVLWKSLTIRAERLSGLAVQDPSVTLAELNRQRSALANSFTHDFTRQPPEDALFYRWTDLRAWRAQDEGLLIVAPGTEHWSSAGASLQKQLEGDFDVSIRFDPLRLDTPAHAQGSSVYLQLELADEHDTQISMLLNKASEGATEAVAQLRLPDGKGGYHYERLGRLSVRSANELRLARRGDRIYCLVSPPEFDGQRIVAHAEIGREPVKAGGTRIMVHTGGAGRESRILWKGIDVRADRITP